MLLRGRLCQGKKQGYTAVNNIEHLHKDLVKSEYERLKIKIQKGKSRLVAALEIGPLIRNHIGVEDQLVGPDFQGKD